MLTDADNSSLSYMVFSRAEDHLNLFKTLFGGMILDTERFRMWRSEPEDGIHGMANEGHFCWMEEDTDRFHRLQINISQPP